LLSFSKEEILSFGIGGGGGRIEEIGLTGMRYIRRGGDMMTMMGDKATMMGNNDTQHSTIK
jgi:hypothetical protein